MHVRDLRAMHVLGLERCFGMRQEAGLETHRPNREKYFKIREVIV
jgi:hypothetical protein